MPLSIVLRFGLLACFSICLNVSGWPMANGHSPLENPTAETQVLPADEVKVLYTGRFLGYMRIPDWQSPDDLQCDGNMKSFSKAVNDFNQAKEGVKKETGNIHGAILLGTGDNFSPEIEAREFLQAPAGQSGAAKIHPRIGKEFFLWNDERKKWIANEDFNNQSDSFKNKVRRGEGTIPLDNVACFFTTAGYAAIVPGKHDFYFGAERLRQLARLLATDAIGENSELLHKKDYGTQMLAANLVIETTWKSDHVPLSDKDNPPRFIPRFPTASDLGLQEKVAFTLSGFPEAGNVYPWYVGPKIRISGFSELKDLNVAKPEIVKTVYNTIPQLREALKTASIAVSDKLDGALLRLEKTSITLCSASLDKSFDQRTKTTFLQNCPAPIPSFSIDNGAVLMTLAFPWKDHAHTYTLNPGEAYRLCFFPSSAVYKDIDNGHTFCLRLTVYQPFLQYPWGRTTEACNHNDNCPYKDPDPYLLLEHQDATGQMSDIAVFGVVDPHLVENIGILNYGWRNTNRSYKTVVAAKDPADALQQLQAFAERRRKELQAAHPDQPERRLLKILLAGMSPQLAEILAANTGPFQIVVTDADENLSRAEEKVVKTFDLTTKNKTVAKRTEFPAPQSILIPNPYFLPSGIVTNADIGFFSWQGYGPQTYRQTVTSFHSQSNSCLYPNPDDLECQNKNKEKDQASTGQLSLTQTFWKSIDQKFELECKPDVSGAPVSDEDKIQLLTLCLIQKETEADVALLQKRDFFTPLPRDLSMLPAPHQLPQEILDRIIWKGDFLTLIYVPGSALKKALDQSKAFNTDDGAVLSISNEKKRGFTVLGAVFDADRGEYLINGVPLDPNKLYAIATSDYVSAGDTGYPDLASSQIQPRVVPSDFTGTLSTISSIVCRAVANSPNECLDKIRAYDYFDEIQMAPVDPKPGKTPGEQLWIWSFLHRPPPVPGTKGQGSQQDRVQNNVQQRTLWDLTLSKLSLGLTRVGHTGDDFDVNTNFSGITSPGVNTLSSNTITSDFQAQLSRNWKSDQIFAAPAYTYNVQYKGQPDDFSQLNQVTDLGSFDLGYRHTRGERRPEQFDFAFTEHFETPLTAAFNAFTLSSTHKGAHGEDIKDQLRFHIDRSYTLLTRPGLRWKRRVSSVEFGPEWGHEWNTLTGINFLTAGTIISCPATSAQTIGQCFKSNLAVMKPNTIPATTRNGQDHTGTYWKLNLTVPFHPRVSYVLTDIGDWFFVRYATETSTSTLLRDYSQHQLKFTIFPSFSIGPEYDVLLYRNKSVGALNGHFLFQNQLIMKAQWSFDIFNNRDKDRQLKYAPSASK